MSLDKAIKYGKEKRKPYYGAKAVDATCRNHGSCPHCQRGRKYKNLKRGLADELHLQRGGDSVAMEGRY